MTTQCMAPEGLVLTTPARRARPVPLPPFAATVGRTRRILTAVWAACREDWHRAAAMEREFGHLREQARQLYLEQSGGRL